MATRMGTRRPWLWRVCAYAYPGALIATILALALASMPAAVDPATAQNRVRPRIEVEFGAASTVSPAYGLRDIQIYLNNDGTVFGTVLEKTARWNALSSVASVTASRSNLAAQVINGEIILYRLNGADVQQLTGDTWEDYATGVTTNRTHPAVAIVGDDLYIVGMAAYQSTIQFGVSRIQDVGTADTPTIETIGSWAVPSDWNKTTVSSLWLAHNRVWVADSASVKSWTMPTVPGVHIEGATTPTAIKGTMTFTTANSYAPAPGGNLVVHDGATTYHWNVGTGQTQPLNVAQDHTFRSIFPTPFKGELFTGFTPAISNIDSALLSVERDGTRNVRLTVDWQLVGGATAYEVELNGVVVDEPGGRVQTWVWDLELNEDSDYFYELELRTRAVLDAGPAGGKVSIGGTDINLAPGERRYGPWTPRYDYALLRDGYRQDRTPGAELPASTMTQPAVAEGVQLVTDVLGLSYAQASALSPLLLAVFAAAIPAAMIVAAPRSPLMLGTGCMLFSATWIWAGWTWFGLPVTFLGLPAIIVVAIGVILMKRRATL